MEKQIIIAQRGWVFVGDVKLEGEEIIITNASCVRKWGTPGKGIGFLAAEGPQPTTVLDACGTVTIHKLAVVGRITCNADNWK
jgi:hypothetical protein